MLSPQHITYVALCHSFNAKLFSSKQISSCRLYWLETNVCCLFFWLNAKCCFAVCKVLFVLIFTDSLGECVSTLSKRFSASESFSDALSGISHSHKDRHSELRHRKQPYIQQETLKTKVIQWSLTSVHDKETDHSKLLIQLSDMIRFFFIPLLVLHYGIRTVLTFITLSQIKNILCIKFL